MVKEKEQKKKWQKIVGGGAIRLRNGQRIKPNEQFEAFESEIPQGHRDLIQEIEPVARKRKTQDEGSKETSPQEQEEVKEREPATQYETKHAGGGKYNVINLEGKAINEELLTKEAAEKLIKDIS